MNIKYQRYIEYIVNDLQPPYFKNMVDMYGLSPDEYELVLSKIFNEPVKIKLSYETHYVYNQLGNRVYREDADSWVKNEYDANGNEIYYEDSDGDWWKREYGDQGEIIYFEDSTGHIRDNR